VRFGGITAEPTYLIHINPLFVAVHQPGAPPLSLATFLLDFFSHFFLIYLFLVLLEPRALATGVLLIAPARYGIGKDSH
jgi:hypothetical protein